MKRFNMRKTNRANSMKLTLINAFIAIMIASSAIAEEKVPLAMDRYAANCEPTPAIARYPYPGAANIHPSSRMARPAGKADYAAGQLLYVHGRVFDSACVPLKNAKVELWHADSSGRHRYAKSGELSNPYPLFTGAGMVHTDNEGGFMFETIFPAPLPNKSPLPLQTPYLNIRVSHALMKGGLQSVIYFADDARNDDDRSYRSLAESVRRRVTAKIAPYVAQAAKPKYYGGNTKEESGSMKGKLPSGVIIHHDITVGARDYFRKF
jgi:protocatechuate 3,4-dioxygenase beta subunit